jgi:hypothetical protein
MEVLKKADIWTQKVSCGMCGAILGITEDDLKIGNKGCDYGGQDIIGVSCGECGSFIVVRAANRPRFWIIALRNEKKDREKIKFE